MKYMKKQINRSLIQAPPTHRRLVQLLLQGPAIGGGRLEVLAHLGVLLIQLLVLLLGRGWGGRTGLHD